MDVLEEISFDFTITKERILFSFLGSRVPLPPLAGILLPAGRGAPTSQLESSSDVANSH